MTLPERSRSGDWEAEFGSPQLGIGPDEDKAPAGSCLLFPSFTESLACRFVPVPSLAGSLTCGWAMPSPAGSSNCGWVQGAPMQANISPVFSHDSSSAYRAAVSGRRMREGGVEARWRQTRRCCEERLRWTDTERPLRRQTGTPPRVKAPRPSGLARLEERLLIGWDFAGR